MYLKLGITQIRLNLSEAYFLDEENTTLLYMYLIHKYENRNTHAYILCPLQHLHNVKNMLFEQHLVLKNETTIRSRKSSNNYRVSYRT